MSDKKPKLTFEILKEDIGYSAFSYGNNTHINTCGNTFEELKEMIIDATNLAFEDTSHRYKIAEISFKYDLKSFFEFYKVINAKALSERIGMNQSLLAQYINGIKKPSTKQTKRILDGVRAIGKELTEVELIA